MNGKMMFCRAYGTGRAPVKRGLAEFFESEVHTGDLFNQEKPKERVGVAWQKGLLRRKSFEHLHQLWYLCLKERNVLATHIENARRDQRLMRRQVAPRAFALRESMANIKFVLSERLKAYQTAKQMVKETKETKEELKETREEPKETREEPKETRQESQGPPPLQ